MIILIIYNFGQTLSAFKIQMRQYQLSVVDRNAEMLKITRLLKKLASNPL